MKKVFLIISLFSVVGSLLAQDRNLFKLANEYYLNGDYEKSIKIYNQLEKDKINFNSIYNFYLRSLLKLEYFSEAEKLVRRAQKKDPNNLKYEVDLGYVWKLNKLTKKAENKFQKTINSLSPGQYSQVNTLASSFTYIGEHEWALKTYRKAQENNPKHNFRFQIANIYRNIGKTELMVDEFILLVIEEPFKRQSIQNTLLNTLDRTKGVGDNFEILKRKLIKEIQKSNNIDLTEMLIWLFMQQDEFSAAYVYSKAIDKRLNENGHRMYELATIAHENQVYKVAIDAYEYLIKKDNPNYLLEAKILKVIAQSEQTLTSTYTKYDLEKIDNEYQNTINELGKNISTAYLIKEYAHLQGFYLNNPEKAVSLLEECINITIGEEELQANCKLELADILLMQGDPWEAILLYSQVEKDFKENPIGHEAKFRRARISYFQGEFDWAQAQLDVLKASTSKLIANNAMDLSLLITDNMGLDTSAKAMQMYARAEFLAFQNKWEASTNTLDSLLLNFSGHTLSDEVIYKKGEIAMQIKNYNEAIIYFKEVAENYSYDILADDALFQWAKLTEEHLNDNEKALMLYEQILLEHNGSIYTSEARKRFRILREGKENIAK